MLKQVLNLFTLIFVSLSAVGQVQYTLKVNLRSRNGGSLELRKLRQELLNERNSSGAKLINSRCKFDGTIDNPIEAFLIFTAKDGIRF